MLFARLGKPGGQGT